VSYNVFLSLNNICHLFHITLNTFSFYSSDRCILIYCPAQSKRFCKTSKAKCLVLIIIIILFLSNGHILYGYEKILLDIDEFNQSYGCHIHHTKTFYRHFFHFYDSYIESICFILIPFIIMTICSILIIVQIIGSRRTVHSTNRLRDKDIQLCCMLIGTSFAFLLLCLPAEINDIVNYVSNERSCLQWLRKIILMFMQQIYYAGHFYIYTLTGQIFRIHLYAILSRQTSRNNFNKSIRLKPSNHRPISKALLRDT
jgi:hypothetical protein